MRVSHVFVLQLIILKSGQMGLNRTEYLLCSICSLSFFVLCIPLCEAFRVLWIDFTLYKFIIIVVAAVVAVAYSQFNTIVLFCCFVLFVCFFVFFLSKVYRNWF